jgi:hypothetical protein
MTCTSAAASEPREIKLHPTAREIGVVPESVTAAACVVGGSLRSLALCLPDKATPGHGQPDHDDCNDP